MSVAASAGCHRWSSQTLTAKPDPPDDDIDDNLLDDYIIINNFDYHDDIDDNEIDDNFCDEFDIDVDFDDDDDIDDNSDDDDDTHQAWCKLPNKSYLFWQINPNQDKNDDSDGINDDVDEGVNYDDYDDDGTSASHRSGAGPCTCNIQTH